MERFFEIFGMVALGVICLVVMVYGIILLLFAVFMNNRDRHDHP